MFNLKSDETDPMEGAMKSFFGSFLKVSIPFMVLAAVVNLAILTAVFGGIYLLLKSLGVAG